MKKNIILFFLIFISAISFIKAQYVFKEDPNYTTQITTSVTENVSIQPNGQVYVSVSNRFGGNLPVGISRFLNNGQIDNTFFINNNHSFSRFLEVNNDKILAYGNDNSSLPYKFYRYLINGDPDLSFGTGGEINTTESIKALFYNSDDSFFVQTQSNIIQKYSSSGFLVHSFAINSNTLYLKKTSDDKFLVFSYLNTTTMKVEKLDQYGNIDNIFGNGGQATFIYGNPTINDNSEIFIEKISSPLKNPRKIYKYTATGQLDLSFGNNALLEITYGNQTLNNLSGPLLFDSQNNIILINTFYEMGSIRSRIVGTYFLRLLPNGQRDYSFNNGLADYYYANTSFDTKTAKMINDNKIICSSIEKNGLDERFSLRQFIRYNPLSTEDLQKNTFKIYPNPATSILNISSSGIKSIESMYVSDVTGKKMKEVVKGSSSVNIDKLAKGMYFLQIVAEGKMQSYKFLKK